MPDNRALMVGGGDDYLPAAACPVASQQLGNGEYMAHRGDHGSFLVADAKVKDGTAAVRLALWRCVYCNAVLVGLGDPAQPLDGQDFTWLERG